MGKCSKCKEEIQYNRYKIVKGLVFCLDCVEKASKAMKKIVTPNEEAMESLKDMGLSFIPWE